MRYSLHHISDKDNCPFDESAYSLFKFGDTSYAAQFGEALFDGFIAAHKDLVLGQEEIVILPSPFLTLPTASNYLCMHFKKHLNRFLAANGKKACTESKIYRNQTYTEDYGNLDYEQRVQLIANDTYYIDRTFIANKCCIFIDDIKITGSHEFTVNRILQQYQAEGTFCFVYFAELQNRDIHPSIENHYNYFAVKDTEDIIRVIRRPAFRFNTRVVKYILGAAPEAFLEINSHFSQTQREELLDLATGNNYHLIAKYNNNLETLKNILWQSTCKKDKERLSALQNSLSD